MPIRGGGLSQSTTDALYIKKAGDIMVGDLEFPVAGFIMNDGTGRWRITIDNTGHLVSTIITAIIPVTGNPIGLLLALTYS